MGKPRIVLSKCFLQDVRYDGGRAEDEFVDKLKNYVEVIEVCPEVGIGLGVPREKLIIKLEGKRKILFQPDTGKDFTEVLQRFSEDFLKGIREVDGFLLKAKSPSCGVGTTKLYKDGVIIKRTSGFFASFAKRVFPYLPIEDEIGLRDSIRRRHFLIRIFVFSEIRQFLERQDSDLLEKFHAKYKYLLLSYNQQITRELDKIVRRTDLSVKEMISLYRTKFYEAFSQLYFLRSISHQLNQKEIEQLQELVKSLS